MTECVIECNLREGQNAEVPGGLIRARAPTKFARIHKPVVTSVNGRLACDDEYWYQGRAVGFECTKCSGLQTNYHCGFSLGSNTSPDLMK